MFESRDRLSGGGGSASPPLPPPEFKSVKTERCPKANAKNSPLHIWQFSVIDLLLPLQKVVPEIASQLVGRPSGDRMQLALEICGEASFTLLNLNIPGYIAACDD